MSATRIPAPEPLGDTALLFRWDERIDADLVAQVQALARALRAEAPGWVRDIVPAYASLAVFVDTRALADGSLSMAQAQAWCSRVAESGHATNVCGEARLVEILVRYGGEDGPDLAHVAGVSGLSEHDVIVRHAAREYRVAMLGFAPGFPYLLGLDPALATPRRAQPRTRVAAGSVGIGGAQTGLYPRDSPGGWQIIGRTALAVFDASREEPSLLQPGDRVRFVAQS